MGRRGRGTGFRPPGHREGRPRLHQFVLAGGRDEGRADTCRPSLRWTRPQLDAARCVWDRFVRLGPLGCPDLTPEPLLPPRRPHSGWPSSWRSTCSPSWSGTSTWWSTAPRSRLGLCACANSLVLQLSGAREHDASTRATRQLCNKQTWSEERARDRHKAVCGRACGGAPTACVSGVCQWHRS